ncbi:unnamed protein product, partial [Rotaria magnacalcarata]
MQTTMEYSCVQLSHLPDEILMIIFKKLHNTSLLYSLIGVNKRLNKIARDSIFTNRLTLLRFLSAPLIDFYGLPRYLVHPLPDPIIDRFCLQILPEIHNQIEWLNIEPVSIGHILLATNYPNLSGLGLYNIQIETAVHLFSDETLFSCTLKNQISSLVIDMNANLEQVSRENNNALLFKHIFTTFTNLRVLNFGTSENRFQYLSFYESPITIISSTLLELHVYLTSSNDCLYLLDGRFNRLRLLHVNIDCIIISTLTINNTKKIPNLTSFSLYCNHSTEFYDELIVPLLHRMSNLEQLHLSLKVWDNKTFRDVSSFYSKTNLPSYEDIQKTFRDFKGNQIISCIDYFQEHKRSQCHIYSYPYQLKHYDDITNNFPGGLFKCVREVSLYDENPFEHEFFLRIAQSFPLLEKLTVINQQRQNNKQFRKSKNENEYLLIVKYPHLIQLNLREAHKDYHEQFLFDNKTCLPNDVRIRMNYQLVKKVTRNFRRNTARNLFIPRQMYRSLVYQCVDRDISSYITLCVASLRDLLSQQLADMIAINIIRNFQNPIILRRYLIELHTIHDPCLRAIYDNTKQLISQLDQSFSECIQTIKQIKPLDNHNYNKQWTFQLRSSPDRTNNKGISIQEILRTKPIYKEFLLINQQSHLLSNSKQSIISSIKSLHTERLKLQFMCEDDKYEQEKCQQWNQHLLNNKLPDQRDIDYATDSDINEYQGNFKEIDHYSRVSNKRNESELWPLTTTNNPPICAMEEENMNSNDIERKSNDRRQSKKNKITTIDVDLLV